MKKITFLVISLMTSASAYGQSTSTTNSIYINQVGEGSDITLTQEGQSNSIGTDEVNRFVLDGNGQRVTVKQDGSRNEITGSVDQANNIVYDTTVTGDDNTIEYNQGFAGSVAGSEKTLTVAGNLNNLTFNQATEDNALNADQNIAFTGNSNTYTSTINTNEVTNNVTVAGNLNNIAMTQKGTAGKNIEMLLTGSTNNISVTQKSTTNVDTIKINSTGSGSDITIIQCNPPLVAGAC
jgi:hypothetical protein